METNQTYDAASLEHALRIVRACGYRATKPKSEKGPTLDVTFVDGERFRLTVLAGDIERALRVARAAWQTRDRAPIGRHLHAYHWLLWQQSEELENARGSCEVGESLDDKRAEIVARYREPLAEAKKEHDRWEPLWLTMGVREPPEIDHYHLEDHDGTIILRSD